MHYKRTAVKYERREKEKKNIPRAFDKKTHPVRVTFDQL